MFSLRSGLYRRPLPPDCIAFSSTEGRTIFREALAQGGMEGYFVLAEQFHTQADPAFCGLGSMVVVLNALAIDPGRIWRGVWRWYGEEMLDCCQPLSTIQQQGISMDEFVCIARCNGAQVTAHRFEDSTLEAFRETLKQVTASPHGVHMVVSYSRQMLGQTGDGHFSPVGGYYPEKDLVLLLDVARFKYPPHWVPVSLLWQAFEPVDPVTQRSRGYLVLQPSAEGEGGLFQVGLHPQQWHQAIAPHLAETLPNSLADAPSPTEAIARLIEHLPETFLELLQLSSSPQSRDRLQTLHRDLERQPLFSQIQQALQTPPDSPMLRQWSRSALADPQNPPPLSFGAWLTLLLLACPPTLYRTLSPQIQAWFDQVRDPTSLPADLQREVAHLQQQIAALEDFGRGHA